MKKVRFSLQTTLAWFLAAKKAPPITTTIQHKMLSKKQVYGNPDSRRITSPNIPMNSFGNSERDDEPGSSSKNQMGPSFRSLSSCNRTGRTSSSSRAVQRSASARLARKNSSLEVMLNDIVGDGISGILYKWVNYGRGWRPRWFFLHDGVLSYYKIHGPDKLILNGDVEKRSKVIGDESLRRIASHRHCPSRRQNPVSEIHLMVSHSFSDPYHNSIFKYINYSINLTYPYVWNRCVRCERTSRMKGDFVYAPGRRREYI